jgi:two-component system LytT family response regulator
MSALAVLVVDDEPLAREMIAALASADADVGTVTTSATAAEAADIVSRTAPDILFIDVEMPEETGIHFADRMSERGPVVVFITAHRQYATDAFAVGAIDYLLKPFSDGRFREALERAKRRVREKRLAQAADALAPSATPGVLAFGSVTVAAADIVWVEAQDYYARLHTMRARHLVRATLASIEQLLDPHMFVRVHRAALVNTTAIRGSVEEDGGLRLALSDGSRVPVSRARRREVERRLTKSGTSGVPSG